MKKTKNRDEIHGDDEKPGTLKLSSKQVHELGEIEKRGLMLKCKIADVTEQIIIAERQMSAMFDELYKVNNDYRAKLDKFASGLGIDVDANPTETGERYVFEPADATFTRHEVVKAPPSS